METESHAVTHVKNEGAGVVCCATGPGIHLCDSPMIFVLFFIPCLSFIIGPFTLHCIPRQLKQKYIKNNLRK